jgi:hypothetical protein
LASAVQSDLETNIDLDILALMPIESDNSSPRFKIITESVSTLLSQFSLIKDIRGTRRTSVELLMIGSSLENLLIDSNLEEILSVTSKSDIEGKHVAIFRRTSNSRINSFLQHVGVGIVGDKELKMYFTRINDAFTLQKNVTPYTKSNLPIPSNLQMYKKIVDTFKNWINSKTDLQITKLLLALGKSRIETNNLASIPLCPAYNEDKNIIFEKIPNLRIPSRPEDTGAGVISRSIYDLAKVEENRTVYKELGEFFNFHEIKVNDEWNYLEKELKRAGTALNIDDELKRVGKFIEIWKQDPSRFQAKARQNLRLYGRFVGKVESFNAEKLNLNFTIGNKKLSQFSGSIKSDDEVPIVIDDYYALDDFAEFAKAIGVKDQLTYFVNDKRYITLPFLKEMLLSGDIPIYRDLWISLLNINQPTAFKFLANGRRYPTHLLEELESYAWVPDRNSNLQLLEDISSDNIHPEFPISNCHFIAESSFGRSKEEFERNSAEKIDIATKAGFQNVQKMELARKIAEQNSFEELEKFLKKESLPGPEVLFDPNNITIEELEKLAPDIMKSPELVEKRRNYREAQQARRSRLREIYGDSGSMICQLCHKEMPFKYPESENSIYWDYFETVSFFISAKKESERNALALCPVCSAKVQHFRKKFPDFRDKYLAEQVIRCFENQTLYMKVQFFGDSHILKFNQQHINDLHAVVVANDL